MADGDVVKADVRTVKVGRFIVIDDIPCKVVDMTTSKPGKHGAAKLRITAIGIFGGQKKTLLTHTDATVEVPVIKKSTVQVLTVDGNLAQVMDKDTYETYEVLIPDEFKDQVAEGKEVEVMEAMGQKAIIRVFKGE